MARDMETVLELIAMIYEAASDSSAWQKFLDTFVRAMGASKGAFGLTTHQSGGSAILRWYGWTDADIRTYAELYMQNDPLRTGFEGMPEGAVGAIHEVCPEHVNSVAYQEFYSPRDAHFGCAGLFFSAPGGASIINVMRAKERGPFEEKELAILQTLMPHLRRAVAIHSEFTSLRVQLATFTGHMDRYPYPFLLIDPLCKVMYSNPAAIEMARAKDGFKISGEQLSMTSPAANSLFHKALSQISANRSVQIQWLDVPRRSQKPSYRLLLTPVPYLGALPLGLSGPAAAVLIIDRQAHPEPDPSVLREVFSLTPAEARVTARLSQGQSADEIAHHLGISVETVRTHIRRVLSKTATGRQGELISLVLRTAHFARFE
jgi:DNA-binding CsgD family transcriptional regulator